MKIINKVISRIEERARGLRPDRVMGRFGKGPIILANSVPKGGTHLLTRCLTLFPRISYTGIHYVRGTANKETITALINKTGANRFSAMHLWWSEECACLFQDRGIRHILMLRNPRDVVVSGVFYILGRKDHHLHRYFSALPDEESRIIAYISGVPDEFSTIGQGLADLRQHFSRYMAWSAEDGTLTIRFEDLVGERGGGDSGRQLEAVRSIAEHIGIPLTSKQQDYIAQKTFFPKSATFRKGAIGQWRDHFTKKISKTFELYSGDLLSKLGYD